MGVEHGAMPGDWLVVTGVQAKTSVWFIDDATFEKYFEETAAG
ncbi:hypothetical protein [uncultured Amnibacterium sp.]